MEDLKKKQEYLQKEIKDKNYDHEEFIDFITFKKENGANIDKWTYDEIINLTNEFKSKSYSKKLNNGNKTVVNEENKNDIKKRVVEEIKNKSLNLNIQEKKKEDLIPQKSFENIDFYKNNLQSILDEKRKDESKLPKYHQKNNEKKIDLETLSSLIDEDQNIISEKYLCKEINCKILEKSKLNLTTFNVTIYDQKIIEGGLFSSKYTSYSIKTEPFNWIVERRYSDFENLRTVLQRAFPGHLVPPLPSKKIGKRRFELDFVFKRMAFLQKFIEMLTENEYFKSSEIILAFLSLKEKNLFDNKMKEFASINLSATLVEDIKTFDGKLKILFNDEIDSYFVNIGEYNKYNSILCERLNENFKFLQNNMINVMYTLDDISKDIDYLFRLNKKVNAKNEITRSYEEMRNFMNSWSNFNINLVSIYNKTNQNFKTYFKQFFKFNKMECDTYSHLLKNRGELREKYVNALLKLNIRKEKAWSIGDVSKWNLSEEDEKKLDRSSIIKDKISAFKIMFPKESIIVNNLQKRTGYLNKMCLDELKRWSSSFALKIKNNLHRCSEDFFEIINETHKTWSDFAANIDAF